MVLAAVRIPQPRRWLAGDKPTDKDFNEVQYALDFLRNPPEVFVTQTVSQNITATTIANQFQIVMDTILYDREAEDNAALPFFKIADPTRITCQTSGWYEFDFAIHWAVAADTALRAMNLLVNSFTGSGYATSEFRNTSITGGMRTCCTTELFLNKGDVVQLNCWSDVVTSTAVGATLADQSYLHARWVSF